MLVHLYTITVVGAITSGPSLQEYSQFNLPNGARKFGLDGHSRIGNSWGTNIHWTAERAPGEGAMLAQGFAVARMDFHWDVIEFECGAYNFTLYDRLLETMLLHGVRPYWILDYSNNKCYPQPPLPIVDCRTEERCESTCQQYFGKCSDGEYYCCSKSGGYPSGCTGTHVCPTNPSHLSACACGNGSIPSPPSPLPPPPPRHIIRGCGTEACIKAFGDFAAAVVQHFKGNNIIFECLNEPNGMGGDNATDIAALCKAAGEHFTAAGELFVGPATSTFAFDYMNKSMAAGLLDGISAVSVHPYRKSSPETVLADYMLLRKLIQQHGKNAKQKEMPIISGEWGYTTAIAPCNYPNKVDELTQASYLARMWLTNTIAGVLVSIDYDFEDGEGNASNCEAHFGALRSTPTGNSTQPFEPKPKYISALVLQNTIGNFERYIGRVDAINVTPELVPTANVFIAKFSNGSLEHGFAVWTNGTVRVGACGTKGWTEKVNCGYYGISKSECLSPSNPLANPGPCCWEPNVKVVGGPQCYKALLPSAISIKVSFAIGNGVDVDMSNRTCWNVLDFLGDSLSTVCADAKGMVEVNVPVRQSMENSVNSPVYMLPK
eukprot:UC4_evm1s108